MKTLTKKQLSTYLLGSTFFGTGGGLPYNTHLAISAQAFKYTQRICIKDIQEFSPNQYLATIYGVGDPSQPIRNVQQVLRKALKDYEQYTGIQIRGLIPGEIGAEGLVFQASAILGIPVVNSDLVGGRAAPEIEMDCFSVFKKLLTPLLGVSANGKSILLSGSFSAKEVESTLRSFFHQQGGVGILIGYPIVASRYARVGMAGTLTHTQAVGEALHSFHIEKVLAVAGGRIIAEGKLTQSTLKSDSGFLKGVITIGGYTILVKNENIVLKHGETKIAQAPDLIILLDSHNLPVHNADVRKRINQLLKIIHIPAQGYWKTPHAKRLWKSAQA